MVSSDDAENLPGEEHDEMTNACAQPAGLRSVSVTGSNVKSAACL